jgi:hypothetical protein
MGLLSVVGAVLVGAQGKAWNPHCKGTGYQLVGV